MSATKYYRLKKDIPTLLAGAILKNENGAYLPISDIWDAGDDYPQRNGQAPWAIEKSPEWFERVYEVSAFGKLKYLTKEAARKVTDQMFNGSKEDKN